MWLPNLFPSLFFYVSGHTPFCLGLSGCLGFTCARNPAQYPAVVEAVQRAGSFPPLTGHCSLNSASGCTGFSCLQHHWLMLVLHLLISVDFHRSGHGFNNPLGLEVLKPHLPGVAKWVSAVLHYCVSSQFPPEKQPFIGTNLRFQRTTSWTWVAFFFWPWLCGLWDLSSSTRDWTHAFGSESAES